MGYREELDRLMALESAQSTLSALMGFLMQDMISAYAGGDMPTVEALAERLNRLNEESKRFSSPAIIERINSEYVAEVRERMAS